MEGLHRQGLLDGLIQFLDRPALMGEIREGLCGIGLGLHKCRQQHPVGVGGSDDPHGAGCGVDLSGFEGEDGLLKIPFDDCIDLGIGLAADAEDGVETPVNMVC